MNGFTVFLFKIMLCTQLVLHSYIVLLMVKVKACYVDKQIIKILSNQKIKIFVG